MPVTKNAISKLSTDESALCLSDLPRLAGAIVYIVKVYFGINPDLMPKEEPKNGETEGRNLILIELERIFRDKYQDITFVELNLSFSESIVVKKEGVSLTVGEIMRYIEDFRKKSKFVKFHLREELNRSDEELETIEAARLFKIQSIELYQHCVGVGIGWNGTVYQSTAIAKENLANQFLEETKNGIIRRFALKIGRINQRKIKYAEMEDKPGFINFVPNPTWEQIYSHAMVIYACKKRKPIILG